MAQPRDDELPIDLQAALCNACGAPLADGAACPTCAASANARHSAWTLLGRALLGVAAAGAITALAYAVGLAVGAVDGFVLGGCVGVLARRFPRRATTVAAVYGPGIAWAVLAALLAAAGPTEPVRVDPDLVGATPPAGDLDPTTRALFRLAWTLFTALPTVALLTREKRGGR